MKDKLGRSYDDIYKELYDLLNGVQQISEELCDAIFERSSVLHFDKGEYLSIEDKECNTLFFVIRGFCSCFYHKDGKECILDFISPGSFCTSFYGFYGNEKSLFNIKAIENTIAIALSKENFNELKRESSEFVAFFNRILEIQTSKLEDRLFRMISNRAEERVKHYMKTREIQYLLKHVHQYSVASYLNMTPETFAKIFGKLNKDDA